ncbi:MAG: prolipoprotein diacylglyceryl transferase [Bacteroidales bacterium]|jgi:prolipoprotein diacylglyceryl transferase|nr:prolipoprotein diacylglyceryl transferase [Bacteroidales bacterium]
MKLLSIIWDVNPVMIDLGITSIHWYGLLFALGLYLGYYIADYMFKKEGSDRKNLDRITSWVIVSTILGARIGHCLFYEPDIYLADPLRILKIWEGGLASHGAGVGIISGLIIYSKLYKTPVLWILDRLAVVTALAGMLIRTGNLMNSEILGHPTHVPWAFIFVQIDQVPRHPAMLYEAICYLLIFILLFTLFMKGRMKEQDGRFFGAFLILVFSVRFLIEFVKIDQVAFEQGMALNMGQILSIPFIIAGIYFYWPKNALKNENI